MAEKKKSGMKRAQKIFLVLAALFLGGCVILFFTGHLGLFIAWLYRVI